MQHLCYAQSALKKEKPTSIIIDTLTSAMRMIDFGLYMNKYRGTCAEKCMNMMYKKSSLQNIFSVCVLHTSHTDLYNALVFFFVGTFSRFV